MSNIIVGYLYIYCGGVNWVCPIRGTSPAYGSVWDERAPCQEETIWMHYRGNPRNQSSRGNITQPRSSRMLSRGHPLIYLPQETCRRKRKTQCNNELRINEFFLPNVSHIKYWMIDLNSRNTPKVYLLLQGMADEDVDRTSISQIVVKCRTIGWRGKMAIKREGDQHEGGSRKI